MNTQIRNKLENCKDSNQLIRSLDRKYVKTKKTGYKKVRLLTIVKMMEDELCQQQWYS